MKEKRFDTDAFKKSAARKKLRPRTYAELVVSQPLAFTPKRVEEAHTVLKYNLFDEDM